MKYVDWNFNWNATGKEYGKKSNSYVEQNRIVVEWERVVNTLS